MFTEAPEIADPTKKMIMKNMNVFRLPNMSASLPYVGDNSVCVTRYALITQEY